MAGGTPRLLREAGFGHDGPLAMEPFAGRLWETSSARSPTTSRTTRPATPAAACGRRWSAVNGAAALRRHPRLSPRRGAGSSPACRSSRPATPMFFMGEEIVAQKRYRYDNIATSKEDLLGERAGAGARMFRYYQDLIRLRRANPAVAVAPPRRAPRPRRRPGDRLHPAGGEQRRAGRREPEQPPVPATATSSGRGPTASAGRLAGDLQQRRGDLRRAARREPRRRHPIDDGRIELNIPANGVLVLQRR